MRILIGMSVMAYRTGAELFVRDLALALNSRGHSVVVYSPIMGEMVEELRWRSIACATDLTMIASAPDVIIGNTRLETVGCLARFPGVPAISICHDRTASHGIPPHFSRIRQYVAVDANCWERLVLEEGIPEDAVQIIPNGVDLKRFQPRSPLPDRPARAAIFSNYATESQETAAIREACNQRGIELAVVGSGTGSQAIAPETVLAEYDVVFAKARCAMEAMAVGCAVVLANEGMGLGGLVTPANVADWHRWNFGRKLLQQPIDIQRVGSAIDSYDARGAAEVSGYMRTNGSLSATADVFEKLAASVVDREKDLPSVSSEQESREFAEFASAVCRPPGPEMVAVQVGMLLARLEAREEELRRANESFAAAGRSRSEELEREAERFRLVEQQLAAVHASRSWRLTAPMRRWYGVASRLFGRGGTR